MGAGCLLFKQARRPRIKASKRSLRLALSRINSKKKCEKERASGRDSEETQLDAVIGEILYAEKATDMKQT